MQKLIAANKPAVYGVLTLKVANRAREISRNVAKVSRKLARY